MTELSLLAIAIGGGLGSIVRFVISENGNWLGNLPAIRYIDS